MKHLALILLLSVPYLTMAQEKGTTIEKVDTLRLEEFKHEKVVRYRFANGDVCVKAEDYINGLKEWHKKYADWVEEANQGDANYEFYHTNFRVIDSVFTAVTTILQQADTVVVSQTVFDKVGLGSLVSFASFIDSGLCAVYDRNGVRQWTIIRQKESYYCGPLCGWGGRRYYFLDQKNWFVEETDWVS